MSADDIFSGIGSDTYTLNDGIVIRCAFIDLGDGTAFVGAMTEHVSLSNGRWPTSPNSGCGLNDNCPHNGINLTTGEISHLYRWSLNKITN